MIRSHSKQTPWINFQEWSSVRCLLLPYSVTEAARIRRGLARVSTWSCRGRVPLSVQITAQLLRIRLSDDVDPMRDPDVLRLAYGMALVRLVNGIVEPEQRTKTYASSVADTAERLGLPRWFVDIRHDATHTNLPSLSTLRMAAETALGWLMSHYWDRQAEHLDSEPKKIASLMNQYDQEVSKQQHKRKRATQESGSSSSSSKHSSSNHSTSTSSTSSTISTQINAIEKRAKLSPSISKATSRTTSRSTSRATSRSGSRSSSPSVSVHSATTTPGGDLRLLAQHISQRISPSIIRTVIIPQLVDHVDNGRLLLYKKFNDTNMTTLKNKWMPVLHAVQQEWPFFYGALLATIVENIGRVCAQKLSTSKRKTDVELSLRWLADDVLTLILASSGSSGIDSSGSSSSSSSSSGGSSGSSGSSINNSSISQKGRPQQNSRRKRHRRHLHRVAPIDRQRLVDCVGVTNAISIYGNLLSSMLEATRMEDAASATRKSNSDVVIGSARAAELLLVDSEMRVLSKTSSVVVGGGVLSAVRPSKVVPQLLLSLEELENSIGMGTTAEEEEDDDEDEEEDEEEDENSRKEIVDKERQEGGTGDRGADDGNEWTLCTTWKSCPIGYVAVDGGENDNSSLLFT